MNTDKQNPQPETNSTQKAQTPKPAKLACTVIAERARIGKLTVGKGHKCRLTRADADALASLNPPLIRIDGV